MSTEEDAGIVHQKQMLDERNDMYLSYRFDDGGKKITLQLKVEWNDEARASLKAVWDDFSKEHSSLVHEFSMKLEGEV